MNTLVWKAIQGLVGLFLAMAVLLFGLAGTFDYWQGWVFLGVYFTASLLISLYLLRADRELLKRRMRGGPLAEQEPKQKLIMLVASTGFAGLLIVPALDHRFGWSHMPASGAIVGDVLVLLGWIAIYRVFRENSFTSATIEVTAGQALVSSGPYAIVRHPMYSGSLVMLIGIPIALASWWGLSAFALITGALVWRILDEEAFLTRNLAGYAAYKQEVRYRLIPHLW